MSSQREKGQPMKNNGGPSLEEDPSSNGGTCGLEYLGWRRQGRDSNEGSERFLAVLELKWPLRGKVPLSLQQQNHQTKGRGTEVVLCLLGGDKSFFLGTQAPRTCLGFGCARWGCTQGPKMEDLAMRKSRRQGWELLSPGSFVLPKLWNSDHVTGICGLACWSGLLSYI